jgi:hypothetical protein
MAKVKAALKDIARKRLARMPSKGSAAADQQRAVELEGKLTMLDSISNPIAAWEQGQQILGSLADGAGPGVGCCTYATTDGTTFSIAMTSDECDEIPGIFVPGPCPPPS